ncbi:hypothetical protein [Micromonospora polyrhachis]|uniref:Uncharacterized protein n=1 Tax=Micromonospora polyrhachis TaxID=1282883 RepID=A0A7W7SV90_9ACTN|nr:hypothetical protein [Micromonospora polyrhachis]MBB4961551.1 hypothetical protein [Micromonospora polyrhachis]
MLEMEGLIRAALGEVDLMDTVSPDIALSAQIFIFGILLQDDRLAEAELESFIKEAEGPAVEFM